MKNRFVLSMMLTSACLSGATQAWAQYANKDIAVYYLLTPTASAKQDQAVMFYPVNLGINPIEQFEARVYKNGELLFTEQVNHTVIANDWSADPVRLQGTVHLDYEEEADVSMRLVLEGDEDTSNDSTAMHITMPTTMDYPFTWTDNNCQENFHDSGFGSLDWQFDDYWGAYYMSDRGTNWMGTLYTDVMEFPVNEAVKCSFEYGTSGGDVTLYFTKDYGDNEYETDTVMVGQSTEDFTSTYYTFRAKGPAIVKVTASLGGAWNASGSIYLRNICFSQAQKDLLAKRILQPMGNVCAVGVGDVQVAARFHNPSADDIDRPTFCYDAGFGTVTETYQGTIPAGQSVDYIFVQPYQCDQVGQRTLKVWCEVEGDSDTSNDLVQKEITYYQPEAFPYVSYFDEEESALWTVVDVNGDGQTFSFEPMAGNDIAATFSNYTAEVVDEQLISPAIRIPAGKHRVNFNFACFNQTGDVHLALSLVDASGQQQLFSRNLDSQLWQTGYQTFDIPAEGIYHFVFEAKGTKDAVVIDNFKVDDGEDLGITSVRFGTANGFNLQTTTVTISYANFGLTPQRDVLLGYSVNNEEMVEELNPAEVLPGDTVSYTFSTLADISTTGTTYDLMGMLLTKGGDEEINDIAYGPLLSNDAPQQIPYFNDFSDEERMAQWLMQSNVSDGYTGWQHEYMSGSYSPMGVLKHQNWSNQQVDSWAFSEGIEMKQGQYEVSYFHHEADWFTGEGYNQNFELRMGLHPDAASMSIEVDSQQDVDVYEGPFVKIIRRVEIPADGIYYLGFHNTSEAGYGFTVIDDVSIEPIAEGLSLPYVPDLAGADLSDWTFYDPNYWYFLQWQTEDGMLTAQRTDEDMWTSPEGMVVSPKLHLEANRKVNVTVNYSVDSATPSLSLCLYAGGENNEATMTALQEFPADQTQYVCQMETGAKPQDIYFGLRTNTLLDGSEDYSYGPFYTVIVNAFKVEYDEATHAIEHLDEQDHEPAYDLMGLPTLQHQGLIIRNHKTMLLR